MQNWRRVGFLSEIITANEGRYVKIVNAKFKGPLGFWDDSEIKNKY